LLFQRHRSEKGARPERVTCFRIMNAVGAERSDIIVSVSPLSSLSAHSRLPPLLLTTTYLLATRNIRLNRPLPQTPDTTRQGKAHNNNNNRTEPSFAASLQTTSSSRSLSVRFACLFGEGEDYQKKKRKNQTTMTPTPPPDEFGNGNGGEGNAERWDESNHDNHDTRQSVYVRAFSKEKKRDVFVCSPCGVVTW